MKIGMLVTQQDSISPEHAQILDFLISDGTPYTEPALHQDVLLTLNPAGDAPDTKEQIHTAFMTALSKKARMWIPVVYLMSFSEEIKFAAVHSPVDVVFCGPLVFTSNTEKILNLIRVEKAGEVYYAPIGGYSEESRNVYKKYIDSFNKDMTFTKKLILAFIPSVDLVNLLKDNHIFCDELVLWSYSGAKKYDILEVLAEKRKQAQKAEEEKKLAKGIIGTVVNGPIGVRTKPAANAAFTTTIAKGVRVKFERIDESVPGVKFGMISKDKWILIQLGPRIFVTLDE